MKTFVLYHLGTREEHEVTITGVYGGNIHVHWGPLCGTYRYNVKLDALLETRMWKAVDVETVRAFWRKQRDPNNPRIR